MDGPKYMTIEEAAEYLRLSRETLYKYAQRGLIPAGKVGRHWRFDRQVIDDWMSGKAFAAQAPARAQRGAASVSSVQRYGLDVLVVDDDAAIRRLLEAWIQSEGHRVVLACDGAEAMNLLVSLKFDLVFLDLHMPTLSGGQVLGRLQEYDNRPLVVLITGYGDSQLMDQVLNYDLLYVLSKPFSRDQVLKLVQSTAAARGLTVPARLPELPETPVAAHTPAEPKQTGSASRRDPIARR